MHSCHEDVKSIELFSSIAGKSSLFIFLYYTKKKKKKSFKNFLQLLVLQGSGHVKFPEKLHEKFKSTSLQSISQNDSNEINLVYRL